MRSPRLACVVLTLLFWLAPVSTSAQETGQPVAPGPVLVVPASASPLELALPLPKGDRFEQARAWQLVEVGASGVALDAQSVAALAPDGQASPSGKLLAAVLPPRAGAQGNRRFHLQAVKPPPRDAFALKDVDPRSLGLWEGDAPVLVYNHGVITSEKVPEKDHRRSRSCYVHPLYGLSGEVLTDDFPKDHPHHHGVFWTWPHVRIEGREHDLWAGNTIRQKFERWLARQTGPVCAVLGVENGWYVGDKKVMTERVWLRAYRAVEGRHRSLDVDLVITPTDAPVTLWGAPDKSYGGLTVRFAPSSRQETVITVPSGPTTDDLPDTRLEWADFTSRMLDARVRSGAAVMVSPKHPDFPPTWLTRHYGPLCVGWPGVKPKVLEPGAPVRLSYRLWIHKETPGVDALREAYGAYRAVVEGVKWQEPVND